MNIPSFNLHSHTFRCGHATGRDEEYVLAAIEAGFKELGFSDHVMLPGVSQPGIRGDYSLLGDYVSSVKELKKRYEGVIKIHLGFEVEWYGGRFADYYRSLLETGLFDYLILGQHCYYDNGKVLWYDYMADENRLPFYRDAVIEAMASGLITYFCHPDLFLPFWHNRFDEETVQITHELCQASKKYSVPMEINAGMVRRHLEEMRDPMSLRYPCPRFWDIVAEEGCSVILGVDAHAPSDYQTTPYDFLLEFIESRHLNLITTSPLTKE